MEGLEHRPAHAQWTRRAATRSCHPGRGREQLRGVKEAPRSGYGLVVTVWLWFGGDGVDGEGLVVRGWW